MRLRIAWVRHSPRVAGRVTRDQHLLSRLAKWHDITVITWEDGESARSAPWRRLFFRRTETDGLRTWVLPKLPRPPGWPPFWASVNQPVFRAAVRALEDQWRPDAFVTGPCCWAVGYPPPTRATRVFDWLDGGDWRDPDRRAVDLRYLDWSEAVIAASGPLGERARWWRRPTSIISNGVELPRFLELQTRRRDIRRRLGVDDARVVSLVGLTASTQDYWCSAVRRLVAEDRVVFAAMGAGEPAPRVERLARELGSRVRWLGPVTYEEACEWFVASDVSWYPADDSDYYHVASPIKIFEGLAAGAHVVVAPRLLSLADLDIANLHFSAPTEADLVAVTRDSLVAPRLPTEEIAIRMDRFSWDRLAARTSQFLEEVTGSHGHQPEHALRIRVGPR